MNGVCSDLIEVALKYETCPATEHQWPIPLVSNFKCHLTFAPMFKNEPAVPGTADGCNVPFRETSLEKHTNLEH